jgi:hypothetical protein
MALYCLLRRGRHRTTETRFADSFRYGWLGAVIKLARWRSNRAACAL